MADHTRKVILDGPEASSSLAASFADRLRPGDVFLLSGSVGAGKTHFARSLILACLEVPEDVPSPTFTLVQTYETPQAEIWHADLYRLTETSEVIELGLTDAFETAVCLVEWPDRLGELAPHSALSLAFCDTAGNDTREMKMTWSDERWTNRIMDILDE